MDVNQEYELVPVDQLKRHPQNPRRGRVDLIAESVDELGWYGAVIAQKSTGYILAGNHRYEAAVARGFKTVPTIWRDVDDQTALKILLADNKIADEGEYDDATLDAVLSSLDTLDGTGYGLDALERTLENNQDDDKAAPEEDQLSRIPDDHYTPQFAVMIVCQDEAHQEAVYNAIRAMLDDNARYDWGVGAKLRLVAV